MTTLTTTKSIKTQCIDFLKPASIPEDKETIWQKQVIKQRVGRIEKMFLTRHIVTLLNAGIPILETITIVTEETKNTTLRNSLKNIAERVENGQTVANSMKYHAHVFSEMFVAMVATGEYSGRLTETLEYLLKEQEDDHRLRTKIRNALLYPAIIVLVMIGMVVGMLTYVIPSIAGLYADSGAELPLFTRILIATSELTVTYGVYVIVFTLLFGLIFYYITKEGPGRHLKDRIVLKSPIAGQLLKQYYVSRFSRSLANLIASGITIDAGLEMLKNSIRNTSYQRSITTSVPAVTQGNPLSKSLKQFPHLYPPLMVRMSSIGEKSGKLDSMLHKIAEHYEESVHNTATNLSTLLEPLLLLIAGLLVGGIAIAILLPIWNITQLF